MTQSSSTKPAPVQTVPNRARLISRMKRGLTAVCLVALGFIGGRTVEDSQSANAQYRQQDNEQRQAFMSGGARSERVLEEISTKISGIDERLERIENLMRD